MSKLVIFLGVIVLLFSTSAFSQQDIVADENTHEVDTDWFMNFSELISGDAHDIGSLREDVFSFCFPNFDEEDVSDHITGKPEEFIQHNCKHWQALIDSEAEKKIALSLHTTAVFERQGVATNVILVLVVLIVISGLALTAYQLRVAAKNGGPQASAELEASAAKVRITSSSVGIVVLTIALLFFYLYVHEIYSINLISAP